MTSVLSTWISSTGGRSSGSRSPLGAARATRRRYVHDRLAPAAQLLDVTTEWLVAQSS